MKVEIQLNDKIGSGKEYQLNCLTHEAKKIGLSVNVINGVNCENNRRGFCECFNEPIDENKCNENCEGHTE